MSQSHIKNVREIKIYFKSYNTANTWNIVGVYLNILKYKLCCDIEIVNMLHSIGNDYLLYIYYFITKLYINAIFPLWSAANDSLDA